MKFHIGFGSLFCMAFLSACGGGGGGTPAVAVAPVSVPLKSAYSALITSGLSKTFTISGTCGGTAVLTQTPAISGVTFDGVAGRLSNMQTTNLTLTGCLPATVSQTVTGYFDTSYTPVGSLGGSGTFGVFATAPTIPATAKVGDSGPISTQLLYTNSTKTVSAGQAITTYTVESDSATSAIVNLTIRSFNAANVLVNTEQDRYRIVATTGLGTLVSVDGQASNGSTTHLILQ